MSRGDCICVLDVRCTDVYIIATDFNYMKVSNIKGDRKTLWSLLLVWVNYHAVKFAITNESSYILFI